MSTALQILPGTNDYYGALKSRAAEIEDRYRALTPKSCALYGEAQNVFPGGFTRDAIHRAPYAPFVVRGEGSTLIDVDGRRLTDLWFNATSLPLGHAHPAVVQAIQTQAPRGTAYFAPTEHELRLAEIIAERLPCAERVRFANSGSEAVMMALRFARGRSGRSLVVKFEGSYHGSYDDVSWSVSPTLAKAGAADAPTPSPESMGLTGTEGRIAVLPFNEIGVLTSFVEAHASQIAAVLVEPMANRMGLLLPEPAFLQAARSLCDRYGVILIFDEVIAFRIGYRGAQGEMGITPDMTTLGKVIGGGFPVGAIAGRADILDLSDPMLASRVTHAGTFNGNPMMAVAGRATMEALTLGAFDQINVLGAYLRRELARICEGLPLQVTGAGSLFKVTATDRPIRNYRDAATTDKKWEQVASMALLNEGFLLTTTMSGCVSTATSRDEADAFLAAFQRIASI
jgi:glutamate-1-semialdehyde 2,1-aminomutase